MTYFSVYLVASSQGSLKYCFVSEKFGNFAKHKWSAGKFEIHESQEKVREFYDFGLRCAMFISPVLVGWLVGLGLMAL